MNRFISAVAALVLSVTAFAQTSIKVQAPNLVGLNEQFNVTFVISGEDEPTAFEWDPGQDFQLVWGPQKGHSVYRSNVNGNRSKTEQTTYSYILIPKSVGHFQLAEAEVTVKGKKYVSERPAVEVVADGAAQKPSSGNEGSQAQATGTVSADDIFMRLTFSKKNVMVGETVTATLKLYKRVSIGGFENVTWPDFNGFWNQEVQAPKNIEFHRENIGDKIYDAAVLRSWNLVPQRAGDLRIDPAELVCLVNIRVPKASTGNIFDSFFQDDYQTIRKRVTTDPVTIRVNSLPAGAPASFGGGVGQFRMEVSSTRDSLLAHEAASLKVSVTGSGNVALLEAPKVNFPPDFEVYDVKTTDIPGGKMFEYPFIPRSYGDFTIDPVEYSYFDISSRKYVTLRGEPLPVKVGKGKDTVPETSSGLQTAVARKDVRDLGSDIRYIATRTPSFAGRNSFLAGSALFWVLAVLLLAIAVIGYFVLKGIASKRADVAGTRNKGAVKMARKRLSSAGMFLKKDLYTAFYEELHKALLGYVSDKLNMDAADMTKENIGAGLVKAGADHGIADEFVSLVDACEFARYSPDSGHDAMNEHYEKAVSVISIIDEYMGRKHKASSRAAGSAMLILMLAFPLNSVAQTVSYADSLWSAGIEAYEAGRVSDAIYAWSGIEEEGAVSAQLYYNLGCAYFKNDDMAHAILYFERALKMNPSYSDARFNLELAGSMIQDNIEAVPEFFLSRWMRGLCWSLSSNAWAVLALVLFALTLAMVLLFLLGHSSAALKSGFITAIVAFLLCISCASLAFWQKSDFFKADDAIVTRAVTTVKSSPSADSAKDLFVLHEGTKVKLLDEVGNWRNIELADGRQGWILSSDLEII